LRETDRTSHPLVSRLLLAIFVALAKSLPAHLVAGLDANSFGWQRSAMGVNIALRAYAHREDWD
jgi:hypothetical protein